ncbi:MAG: hypothetical protein US94_C0014G0001, partial [Berkelbacteria bacterium GW2011_GWB1_38_5]
IFGVPNSDAIWFSWLDSAFDINTRRYNGSTLDTELLPVAGAAVVLGPAIVGNSSNLYLVYQKVADTTILVRQSRSLTDGTTAWSGTETTLEDHASENLTYPSIGEVMNQDYLDVVYSTATNAIVRHMSASLAPPISISGTCYQYDRSTPCADAGAEVIAVAINGVLQAQTDGTVDGSWIISGVTQPSANATITVFINGEATPGERATAVTKYNSGGTGNIGGVTLYQRHLTIGSDQNTTVAHTDMDDYDYNAGADADDSDIIYDIDASNDLTVDNLGSYSDEMLLIIGSNTYRPDSASSGNVITHDIEIDGTVTADNNTFYIGGSWNNDATFTANGSTVNFNSTTGTETIDSTGASVSLFNALTHTGASTLQLVTAIDVNSGGFSQTAGTFNSNSQNQNFSGAFSLSVGTTYTKGGTLTFDGGSQVVTDSTAAPGQDLGVVTIGPSTTTSVSTANKMNVTDLTIGADDTFDISSDTLTVRGTGTPFTKDGTFTVTSSTVVYAGAGATNITTTQYNNLTFTPESGTPTYSLTGNLTTPNDPTGDITINASAKLDTTGLNYNISVSRISIQGGELKANDSTITLTGTSGILLTNNSGTFTYDTSAVIMNPDADFTDPNFLTSGSINLYDLQITPLMSAHRTYTFGSGVINIYNNFDINPDSSGGTKNGIFYMGDAIAVSGATTITETGNTTSTLDTVDASDHALTSGSISIATTSSTLNANGSSITLTGTGSPLSITGAFNTGDSTVVFSGNGAVNINALTYYNLTFSPTLTAGVGDIVYTGAGATAITNNWDIYPSGSANSLTYNLGGNITGNPNITIRRNGSNATSAVDTTGLNRNIDATNLDIQTGGTLAVNGSTIAVLGNWSNSGTFTANSSTVTFRGTNEATVSGSSTFNHLTMNTTTDGAKTIKFTAGTTQTINGTWTLDGDVGKVLTLRSTLDTNAWGFAIPADINPAGDYIDVKDSQNNTNAYRITAGANTTDNGNNVPGWIFVTNTAPNDPSALAQKKTTDVTITVNTWTNETSVKFTATASDTDNPDTLYLCIEKDQTSTAFSGTEDSCGSGVAYSGTPVTVINTISGQTDATAYHWQARIKDAANAYSGWVSFGGNTDPNDMDYGIDTTAPTGGSVTDSANTGSLTQLGATLSGFDANASGLNKYEYAIGTTSGGTDTKTWTDNGTSTTISATGLNLQTSVTYYFTVRVTDNATNVGTAVNATGQMVLPTLSFTLGSTSVNFNNLNAGNSYTDTKNHTLGVTTNAANGYSIYGYTTQLLTSLQYPSKSIANYAGTWAVPTTWSGYGFGYTSSDDLVQGSDRFGTGTKYAGFSQTVPGNIVADHTAAINGSTGEANDSWTITYQVATSNIQEASTYQTTAIYIAVPNF